MTLVVVRDAAPAEGAAIGGLENRRGSVVTDRHVGVGVGVVKATARGRGKGKAREGTGEEATADVVVTGRWELPRTWQRP